jgi:hypothetical protein
MSLQVEIHLTTSPLAGQELDQFAAFCQSIDAKPIIIELPGADVPQHPMISQTVGVNDRTELDDHLEQLKKSFNDVGYSISRVKLEVDIQDHEAGQDLFPDYRGGYFEWHGQVSLETSQKIDLQNPYYPVHISQNALRDWPDSRILTLRNAKKALLLRQVKNLVKDLDSMGEKTSKQHFEYCCFDSNVGLDDGWLDTPEITDTRYLNLVSYEAFLRRAAQVDMPFMLKGSLLSRQYHTNKEDRTIEDIDFLYFGEVRDDQDFMTRQFNQWAQAVTATELDDDVSFSHFENNAFWRMIEYAMHEDFPTVNTDLTCRVHNTENPLVPLDISWGIPLNVEPVPLMYHPLEGEPFEIKYTTPLCLQISWKLHQSVVRPRLKDLIDICDLIRDCQPTIDVLKQAVNEYLNECLKDRIDPLRLLNYLNGSIRKYLKHKPGKLARLFNKTTGRKPPLPDLGELTYRTLRVLNHQFPNHKTRYQTVDDVLADFADTLNVCDLEQILTDLSSTQI